MTDALFNPLDPTAPAEELHEDLKPWLSTVRGIGPCLRHPLVFSVPYHPMLNAQLNRSLQIKRDEMEKERVGKVPRQEGLSTPVAKRYIAGI